jgi:uncharacterized glyoxalase superfamily protein PhnB
MLYFSQTILYVEDVHHAIAFYKKAFGLDEKFISEGGEYGEIESQSVALAFVKKKHVNSHLGIHYQPLSLETPPPPMEVCFIVDDVDAVYQTAVDAGATTVSLPAEKPWGQRVAYVRDPDGFLIEIGAKMSL